MQKTVTIKEMQTLENAAIQGGVNADILMENAGRLIAQQILNTYAFTQNSSPVIIVCGVGNNAGDGLVAARYLMENKVPTVCFIIRPDDGKYKELVLKNIKRAFVCTLSVKEIDDTADLQNAIKKAPLVIDAVLGLGAKQKQPQNPLYTALCTAINTNPNIVSIDGPTGIDMDSGLPYLNPPVKAQETYCLGYLKTGLMQDCAKKFTGNLILLDIFSGICRHGK